MCRTYVALPMLTKSPKECSNHTRGIYRCASFDRVFEFARFLIAKDERRVNAFYHVWIIFPTHNPLRLVGHVNVTRPCSARRGLPYTDCHVRARLTAAIL